MTIVMNMSGYEIEHDSEAAREYGDEVMYTGWNPQLGEVTESTEKPGLPGGLAEVDVNAFLEKMYKYQR
jgi:hypothetical protein